MTVLEDLRTFFLPEPTPRRMEKKESPPPRRPRRPPRRAFKKRPGGLTKFLIEAAHLPVSVAEQIEGDIERSLRFSYTGRETYRDVYLAAGVSSEDIPDEELEELPGAGGIFIPILGWEIPSERVRKIAKTWIESVTSWSDISLALEGDFVWKKILSDWGVEDLRVVEQHPVTGRRGIFVLDAAGNALESIRQIKDEYPLTGWILDWVRFGDVRSYRQPRFDRVKRTWLGQIRPLINRAEGGVVPTVLRDRIKNALDKTGDERTKLVNELWRDFIGRTKQGYTLGIPEPLLKTLKVVEYRGFQFEVHDFFDLQKEGALFRTYLWTTKPYGLRVHIEKATARYLQAHPHVRAFLHRIFSPVLSPYLTEQLLDDGRLLPNRLIGAFLRRLTTQRFPKEVLANLRGILPPDLYREIGKKSLAELKAAFDAQGHLKAYLQLENALYVKWRRWFLPGRFIEWVGDRLTKVQQAVFKWIETQMVKGNLVGRFFENVVVRVTGKQAFVDQALGKGGLKKVPLVAGARRAAAGVALRLRRMQVFRKVARKLAQWLVKLVQGASKLTGPVGAAITTAVTFFGGRIVAKLWEKGKPVAKGVALVGCGCLSALVMVPFLLLVFIIAPAFQPGELGGWLGEGEQLVRVEKTVNPSNVAVGPHPMVDYKLIVYNLSGEEEMTAGTLVDEFDPNEFTPSVLGGADNSQAGKLVWTVDSIPAGGKIEKNYDGFINSDTDKHVVNNATFTATLGDGTVSDTASAVVFVGTGGEGRPPSGWPTVQGCITQGPKASGSGATHSALEAVDIAPVVQGSPTDADLEVFATHDGTAYVDRNAGYGPYIMVVSPAGFTTVYGHLEEAFAVGDGDSVHAGQRLGKVFVGVIGESSGTHLHYEFRDLQMEPPYIPAGGLRKCVGRTGCNFCF